MNVPQITNIAWIIWYVTWLAAVIFSARTRVQKGSDVRSPGRILMGIGLMSMLVPGSFWLSISKTTPLAPLARALWSAPELINWIWFGLVLAGFAFCWWARFHLGRLWSGFTTLKDGHYIVDTGPYGIVRHPIYSGIIFAALMTAGLDATILSALGFLSITLGVTIVARLEERFLHEQLGAQAYDAYAARVPMLAPFWRSGSRGRKRPDGRRL